MKKAFLLLVAIIGVPLVWVLLRCLLEALAIDTLNEPFFSRGRVCFIAGCVAMTLLYIWRGSALQVVYIFAHEMTHAVAGLCCFSKVYKVSIKTTGGFVQLSKSNLLITLAPYCVPFYLLIAVLIYGILQYFVPGVLPFEVWAGLFGVLATFHVWYTANALFSVSQPDTHEYGRFFSWWFIVVANLLFALAAVVVTSPTVTARGQGKRFIVTTQSVYVGVYETLREVTHAVIAREGDTERKLK
jgi:hypothetical protein